MSSPSRAFTIIDQALNLQILFDKKRVEGVTSIRMCLKRDALVENLLPAHLCAKQINVSSVEVSDFDFFNRETNQKERIDESQYTKHWFYPDNERQLKVIRANMDKCPPSYFSLREMMKKIYKQENLGFLKTTLELTTRTKTKVEDLFEQGYQAYITIKVAFSIDEPVVSGSFSKSTEGGHFFIKSNKISLTRCLFPCLDFIDDYYKISRVRIITDLLNADVLCLGKQVSKEVIGNRLVVDFDVNRIINVNYLALFVGKFEVVKINLPEGKSLRMFCQTKNLAYRVQTNESDYVFFFNRLKDFEQDVLKLEKSNRDKYQWICLDSVDHYPIGETVACRFAYRGDGLFFYKTVVLDCGIVLDKKSLDTYLFAQSESVLRFGQALHLDKVATKTVNDYWIFAGASQFLADAYLLYYANETYTQRVFENKKRLYYSLVRQGKDINPLNGPNLMHPAEAVFDQTYNLKCCLIFHLIYGHLKLNSKNVGHLASRYLVEGYYDPARPTSINYMDTKRANKNIKMRFGIKKLKSNLQQFLINTGCSELDCAYTYDKKGNRMKLVIRQTPLHLSHYKAVMNERFALEKFFNITSPIRKILDSFQTNLYALGRNSEGFITTESVNAFLEDDGRILMNSYCNSLKYLSGNFSVIVTETNDLELNEEIYDIRVEDKQEQQVSFDMRTKLRRVVQKKGAEIDGIAGVPIEPEHYHFAFASGQKYNDKTDSLLVGGAPYLWIKIDPYYHYLRRVIVREGENIYLAQLEKEMKEQLDIINIYRILESLVTNATKATLCKLETYVKAKDVDQLVKVEMINTLTSLPSSITGKEVSELLHYLIKQIKFDRQDSSLKPNDFTQDYYLLNHLIDMITRYERRMKRDRKSVV